MSRTPLLVCPECGKKAVIKKTSRPHKMLNYHYCSCSDPECGLTFKMKLEFDSILSPSAKGLKRLGDQLLKQDSRLQLSLDIVTPV